MSVRQAPRLLDAFDPGGVSAPVMVAAVAVEAPPVNGLIVFFAVLLVYDLSCWLAEKVRRRG